VVLHQRLYNPGRTAQTVVVVSNPEQQLSLTPKATLAVFWRPEADPMYLWLKAFHIISVITWFAGIFYLPRLFVYHASAEDEISNARFKVMEDKLYRLIMTPSMLVALGLGFWMLIQGWAALSTAYWIWVKLVLVLGLVGYHLNCGRMVRLFAEDRQKHSERYFRIYNELPVLLLVPVVLLVVIKPF
jgi:putative membrane protein